MTTNISGGSKSKGSAPTASIKAFKPPIEPLLWDEKINRTSKYPNLGTPILSPTSTSSTTSLFIPGNLEVNGTIYGTIKGIPSDSNIKENINTISLADLDSLLKLEAKQYNYRSEPNEQLHYGFVAQDVEEVFPNLVDEIYYQKTKTFIKTVNYLEMIPLLLAKIQDLQSQIDELKQW
jgi:hypothetical protein